jgi:vesicle-associated membrane protein 7
MPILYTVIARGSTILTKYASCVGNFSEVTEQILNKISAENSKLTYSHNNFLFHYIKENGIVYLCITDDDFERARAFAFLADIKNRFEQTYGLTRIRDALPYAMNSDFANLLASEMKRYSESRDLDKVSKVQGQLDELKDIMVKNIDNIASRGERLELLVNKAENLNTTSVLFRKSSRNVARAMYWRNIKFGLIVGGASLLFIYIIISMSCGGLAWSSCLPSGNSTGNN